HAPDRGRADGGRHHHPPGHLRLRPRRGLRPGGQSSRLPALERPPAQVPGEDGALQRARRPDAVRDGRAPVSPVSTTTHVITPLIAASGSWMMYAGLAAVGVGLLVVLVMAIPGERELTTEERVVQYAARAGNGTPAHGAITAPRSEGQAL